MEYMNLIMQAFSAALDFFTQLVTADQFIADVYITLCFVSVLTAMFVAPFLAMRSGSGSDKVSKSSNRQKESSDHISDKESL